MRQLAVLVLLFFATNFCLAQKNDSLCYEIRIYTCEKGKLNDLLRRFRNHTTALFEKHGMTNLGYFTPIDNTEEKLYYVLSYPSFAKRNAAFDAFRKDSAWINVRNDSEKNGKIVAKVESIFLRETPYSPHDLAQNCNRVWELRIYNATPNNLGNLQNRFRDHTINLFKKYGINSHIYWTPMDTTDNRLIYFVTHPSEKEGRENLKRFGETPEWKAVKAKTEANGQLRTTIESIFMYPVDFSRWR